MRAIELAVIIVVIASSAAAAPSASAAGAAEGADVQSRYTKAYTKCPGFETGVTPDMLDCIASEYDIQDKRLNLAFAAALRVLSPSRKTSLRTAQRAWLAYRDAWCGITYDKDSGQAEHIASNQCMVDQTIQQTIALEELARYTAAQ